MISLQHFGGASRPAWSRYGLRPRTSGNSCGPSSKGNALSDAWLRRAVMAAIVLLVLHAVGTWTYAALGVTAAVVAAVLIGAVSIFSARMAGLGQGNNAWFIVPTLVFTALPLAARSWVLV